VGWFVFPAQEDGWDQRRQARGLDPLHLREVPLRAAASTGILENEAELAGVA
jgi:hypothetical protein